MYTTIIVCVVAFISIRVRSFTCLLSHFHVINNSKPQQVTIDIGSEMCGTTTDICHEVYQRSRVYLPAAGSKGLSQYEGLKRYVETEFPEASCGGSAVYSVPRTFTERTERQASRAELCVFQRLQELSEAARLRGLWMLFFHGACYAGHSYRNQRVGKLMIREHDFVVFVKYKGVHHVCLLEVKSTHDSATPTANTPVISDARVVKNNKRSAQHQLRDHLEVLQQVMDSSGRTECCSRVQAYIMWPFLGAMTRDPRGQLMRRWREDGHVHVFEDVLREGKEFEGWVEDVLQREGMKEEDFVQLLNRFVTLSCGVFVDEIYHGMLALLTQEQLKLLTTSSSGPGKWGEKGNGPLVVHGAAGTGKTLLVLKKLQLLYEQGELNQEKRALYICYWPGIRCDFKNKLKILGIDKYVDSARFYISQTGFLLRNKSKYKHIFMDEAEAICLSFEDTIMMKTVSEIYQRYHDGNCKIPNCTSTSKSYKTPEEYSKIFANHQMDDWGQLWFLVDINQASLFLPKHSPAILKIPKIVLNRVMRSTGLIFDVFKQFYSNPMPFVPQPILDKMNLNNINMGHDISGPPILWVDTNAQNITNHEHCNQTLHTLVCVVIDLCATKGIKPNNICVIPFLVNEKLTSSCLNEEISLHFVENGYKPQATGDVEGFVTKSALNDFLISWALRVKGLEFKVVVLVIEDDDFDINDAEDRKKMYIMASRCTCLLIVIGPQVTKKSIDCNNVIRDYSFDLQF